MDKYESVVKDLFVKHMTSDACDLAELIFTSEKEKEEYIENAWKDYGDDIIAFVDGWGAEEQFIDLSDNEKNEVMIEAIKANFRGIFEKNFDE